MYKILLQENFTEKLSLVAHSPLIRAKETCYGILDLNSDNDSPQLVELDCLSEVTPYETLLQGRLPLWKRINSLYKWIQNQEADTIALVGHSEYFKIMLGLKEKFKNCDVWKATYSNGQWTDLELKHRLSGFS
jgi:broad specificity phosphatase PhoE